MTDKYDGSTGCLEGAPAFCGVLTTGAELHREAEACRRCAALAFGRAPRAGDVPAFGLEHLRDCDTAAAAELKADGSENVYVVTCFSDRDKILSQVVKEA